MSACGGLNEYFRKPQQVACGSDSHTALMVAAVFAFIIYAIGIPVLMMYLLLSERRKHGLHDPTVLSRIGFFYDLYHARVFWFEMVRSFLEKGVLVMICVVVNSVSPMLVRAAHTQTMVPFCCA